MSTNKNFVVKNGLDVGTTNVIDNTGKIDFGLLKNKPTTLAGFGITDGASGNYAPIANPVFTGNIGVGGTTPRAWGTDASGTWIDGPHGTLRFTTTGMELTDNMYYNAGWKAIAAGGTSNIISSNGVITLQVGKAVAVGAASVHGDAVIIDDANPIANSGYRVQIKGDVYSMRPGNTTGVYYFGNTTSKYLYYDGTNFNFSGGSVYTPDQFQSNGHAFAQGTGSSYIYNDNNVNNFVIRTGPSSGYKWSNFSAGGDCSVPGHFYGASGQVAYAANVIPHTGSARFHDMAANAWGTDYNSVGLQIREHNYGGAYSGETAAAPRISFHWGSRAAAQIGMNANAWITLWNNPGNGYENLLARDGLFTGDVTAFYSDMRLKTKVKDIEDPVGILKKLNGFYYEENDLARSFGYNTEGLQIGLSAQEVKAVLPEIVKPAPFDQIPDPENFGKTLSQSGENYMTVDYARVVPVIVEAVKQQDDVISMLLKEIQELKSKVAALEAK